MLIREYATIGEALTDLSATYPSVTFSTKEDGDMCEGYGAFVTADDRVIGTIVRPYGLDEDGHTYPFTLNIPEDNLLWYVNDIAEPVVMSNSRGCSSRKLCGRWRKA